MRCLALGQEWRRRGGRVVFLTRCAIEALHQRIRAAGAEFWPLVGGMSAEVDIDETLSAARQLKASFVILDGYEFDLKCQIALKETGCRLMIIDDTLRLPRYETDILLNQNLGAERLEYACNAGALTLLGPKYALLRREFVLWRGRLRTVPEIASKILVTLGGSDPGKVTLKVIEAIRQLEFRQLQIRVVVGPANSNVDELRNAAAGVSGDLELLTSVSDMAEIMAWADVAVAGAGSTSWELACLGLPAATLVVAENQRMIAEELRMAGLAVNLGWHAEVSPERIAKELERLLFSSYRRLQMSQRGRALVDGKGAERVAVTLSQRSCMRAA